MVPVVRKGVSHFLQVHVCSMTYYLLTTSTTRSHGTNRGGFGGTRLVTAEEYSKKLSQYMTWNGSTIIPDRCDVRGCTVRLPSRRH